MSGRIVITNRDRRIWVSYNTRIEITDWPIFHEGAYGRNRFSISSNHTNEETQVSDLEKNAIIRHAVFAFLGLNGGHHLGTW
jgi:hypothetical protein